jgi:hypothetical protein
LTKFIWSLGCMVRSISFHCTLGDKISRLISNDHHSSMQQQQQHCLR